MDEILVCTPKDLPSELRISAARRAAEVNPANQPRIEPILALIDDEVAQREFLQAVTTKYWHNARGVRLTVAFLDGGTQDLRTRILSHMNAWGATANVQFAQTAEDGQVRIARAGAEGGGYWSYLGTDILEFSSDKPTMNLQDFTMKTSEAEYRRVVRHETGHTLGFEHEHLHKALVDKIDPEKAIQYYEATQGWNEEKTRAAVLTPLEQSSLLGTRPDPSSIMCYQIPGSITKDGEPILGGVDIDESDYAFAGRLYPKPK